MAIQEVLTDVAAKQPEKVLFATDWPERQTSIVGDEPKMKRLLYALLIVVLLSISACSSPADSVSKAKTVTELDALVERFLAEQNFDAALAAAEKAIELDPKDTEHYIAAVSVIRKEADVKFERARALLESASRIAYDAAAEGDSQELDALAEWVENNRPELPWGLPPLPDYTSKDQINTAGNTISNLMSMGWVAGQGDWVYFRNTSDNNALYKTRSDGSRIAKIGDDKVSYLNVIGDWIYYCCENEGNTIYKIRTDGSERTKICDSAPCYNVIVIGDWIYYLVDGNESGIYRVHTDGSEKARLCSDDIQSFGVFGDQVYYVSKGSGGKVRKMLTDGSDNTPFVDQGVISFVVAGDWIYYNKMDEGGTLYKSRLDGTEEALLDSSAKCVNLNIVDDWIYYTVRLKEKRNSFAKLRTDGTGREILSEVSGDCINIIGNWMYYINGDDNGMLYRMRLDGSENQKASK